MMRLAPPKRPLLNYHKFYHEVLAPTPEGVGRGGREAGGVFPARSGSILCEGFGVTGDQRGNAAGER